MKQLTVRIGYLGFYPPRPDQDEDLSEVNVKNGFTLDPHVSVGTPYPRPLTQSEGV